MSFEEVVGPVLEINYRGYRGRGTKYIWEDQRHLGGPKSWRTKKLNRIRSLGDQTTWGTNKIQEAGRGGKLNIQFDNSYGGVKIQNTHN